MRFYIIIVSYHFQIFHWQWMGTQWHFQIDEINVEWILRVLFYLNVWYVCIKSELDLINLHTLSHIILSTDHEGVLWMNISGGYGVATGGPLAWGLCYNREMSPSQSYCDDSYKYTYPCSPGAEYYGRGALPIYWCVCSWFFHFHPHFHIRYYHILIFTRMTLISSLGCNYKQEQRFF